MPSLTVRNIPDEIYARFQAVAASAHRSVEAHARYLLERATQEEEASEVLEQRYSARSAPGINPEAALEMLEERKRRSPRP